MTQTIDTVFIESPDTRIHSLSRGRARLQEDYPLLAWVTNELRKVDSLRPENELIQTARGLIREALRSSERLTSRIHVEGNRRGRKKTA